MTTNALSPGRDRDLPNQEEIVPEMLIDWAQRDVESLTLAELLVQELNRATKMVKRGPAQEGFVVLQSPDMPSVLIELGYLSNPADEKALADDAHIARLATVVARAVDAYSELDPPDYGKEGRPCTLALLDRLGLTAGLVWAAAPKPGPCRP